MTGGMTGVCCYTSFTYAYLGRARTLLATLRLAHPDWTICAVVVDEPANGVPAAELLASFDLVLGLADLGIPRLRAWLFKHDVVEACTAIKGAAMLHLMGLGFATIIYLDPDIAVFEPLDPVTEAFGQADIVLTPHQVTPNGNAHVMRDNELTSMRFGIFNLGFIAVRNTATGQAFAEWWATQLRRACYDDPEAGLFTDQRYVDLVPGLFDGVAILRDAGCNVASWNLSTRRIIIGQDGGISVNGVPLRFYHFTKINSVGDLMVDRYAGEGVAAFEIWSWYRRQIALRQPAWAAAGQWHYGSFSNGVPIRAAARRLYRDVRRREVSFDDPFDAAGPFYALLADAHPALLMPPG